jgi:hypothetical protein
MRCIGCIGRKLFGMLNLRSSLSSARLDENQRGRVALSASASERVLKWIYLTGIACPRRWVRNGRRLRRTLWATNSKASANEERDVP